MEQYTFFQPVNVLSVRQLNAYLHQLMESDPILQDIWIEGEISNFARPSSGHLYFTLKDTEASIRCVMWRSAAQRLKFSPTEGLAVQAHGSVSVYEATGQVQLYIDSLKPAGEGALFQEFIRLKNQLEEEGLFDPTIKKALPTLPSTIGIVTSATGAALQDMLDTLQRRYPVAEVILSPTLVQGIDAPRAIIKALNRLVTEACPDVILIGRGGGSIEDLWAFNDEHVARAVAACPVPIISGVGHETDFTLTDFAADYRAPTPTAAAEIATPDRLELRSTIDGLIRQAQATLNDRLTRSRWELSVQEAALSRLSPMYAINNYRQRLDEVAMRLDTAMQSQLKDIRRQLAHLAHTLESLNPQAVLKRGYAIVIRKKDGQIVTDAGKINADDLLEIRVSRGQLDARVTTINQESTDAR